MYGVMKSVAAIAAMTTSKMMTSRLRGCTAFLDPSRICNFPFVIDRAAGA
ncbi:MAG: hypothetical protein L2C94_003280 [Aigarchaeota archaeon]|nr:hypothetical protein [Candidatus Wolframiiraptor gerlachensis]